MADIIFRGGTMITMSAHNPRAEAIAIRGQRILARVGNLKVGDSDPIQKYR
jgi:predicted amidohydrolase YtcJ